ncbi:MAG: hypothetical protein IT548_01190 [Alphaproteobacteria bacterium]|nr:hypothetical protein [Alphaproteobacteria bacterium]
MSQHREITLVPTISPLIGADEFLNHQIPNTHGVVYTPDRSWTEKIWFTLMRKDAQLQASFGLGKYANRNVLDGFGGIAVGTEQRTVRASRLLRPNIDELAVGPLRYEVIEPFRKLRIVLEENVAQPLQYDLTFTDRMPAFFEGRDYMLDNGRNSSDVVRYHQAGTVEGWILIDGQRVEVRPEEWFGFRDHSWGVREHVGLNPTDLAPHNQDKLGGAFHFNWFVSQITRPDGSMYDLAYYFREFKDRGMEHFTGFINESDGAQTPLLFVYPELKYRKADRAVMGGTIYTAVREGRKIIERQFEVEAINPEMGFRLNPALYGLWKGQLHGSFKGQSYVDGECVEDVNSADKTANNPAWQIRDRPMRIREGDNHGFADIESCVIGDWPAATLV